MSAASSSRGIIVLGGHRCGTSLVAGVLHHLGIPAGLDESPQSLLQGRPDNPTGHFEDRHALVLHRRMLRHDRWRDPQPERFVLSEEVRGAYRRHLSRRAARARLWCLKDPRLCFLLPVLATTLDELQVPFSVVTVVRRLGGTAASLIRRNRMGRAEAMRIACRYEGARRAGVAWLAERGVPLLAVRYGSLRRTPAAEVARLACFTGVVNTPEAVAFVQPAPPRGRAARGATSGETP
jgi:hypothetical protein